MTDERIDITGPEAVDLIKLARRDNPLRLPWGSRHLYVKVGPGDGWVGEYLVFRRVLLPAMLG